MGIEARQLGKRFGTRWVVKGLDLTVRPGEVVGLLGPNGAGKSTTMRMLTGYLAPSEGEVTVNGIAVHSRSTKWKYGLGYLPENNPLHRELYVREYLTHVALMNRVKNRRAAIEYAIGLTGLEAMCHRKIGYLSKGYKQRVGLAASLIHNPETIILDEPTTGLDPNQIVEIRQAIREVGQQKAILLSSHIMQEIEALCDRVAIIHQGLLVANGKTSEVMSGREEATIVVGFTEAVDRSELEAWLPGALIEAGPNCEWIIRCPKGKDMRAELSQRSSAAGRTIITLYRRTSHLEDVFRELTNS